jgi:hypothetical protein
VSSASTEAKKGQKPRDLVEEIQTRVCTPKTSNAHGFKHTRTHRRFLVFKQNININGEGNIVR